MNTTLSFASSPRRPSPENPSPRSRLSGDDTGRSRFTAHRAPSLISRPRLEEGLWRPLRLDLLQTPLTRHRE